jgi:hypothetical protein
VSHAGSPLLADLADVTTPMAELAEALDRARDPQPRRDPGRVLVDLAVAVANGAEAVGDITVLANQPPLFMGGIGLHVLAATRRPRRAPARRGSRCTGAGPGSGLGATRRNHPMRTRNAAPSRSFARSSFCHFGLLGIA